MLQSSSTLRFEFLAEALVVTWRSLEVLAMCLRRFVGGHDCTNATTEVTHGAVVVDRVEVSMVWKASE